ncbi:MAG: transglutaminase family protein [Alphaproteobacteria bacterium]|nr:transglutaminase family protein [Alphaproteobacteria bacterium]
MIRPRQLARRALLAGGGALFISPLRAQPAFRPRPGAWRTFDLVTRLEPRASGKAVRVWVPLPSFEAPDWQRAAPPEWLGNAQTVERFWDTVSGAEILSFAWDAGARPATTLTIRVRTRERAIGPPAPGRPPRLSETDRRRWTTRDAADPAVLARAREIASGAGDDVARALHLWVASEGRFDANARGRSPASLAAENQPTGDAAALNGLFVALARALEIPARRLAGLRVAASRFEFTSLGPNAADLSRAQHTRAEVWLAGSGWTAADPADACRVRALEPRDNLGPGDARLVDLRAALFGAAENNWIAFNAADSLGLPGATRAPLALFDRPVAETPDGPLPDDPDAFAYTLTAREIDG